MNGYEIEGEEEEAVAVTMRFEGPNAERDRQIRQKSYQYFQQKNASEPWINLNYHKHGSVRSATECEKLLCSQVHQDSTSTVVAKEDYLRELVPECLRLSGCQTSKDEDAAVLPDKPLSDQIRHLMINAHLLTFSMLAEKLPQNVDTLSIERLLQQIGVLVQGCWAVKSELLYAENTVSPDTGVSAKQLINARDYILWLFTKTRFVTRQDILSAIRPRGEGLYAQRPAVAIPFNECITEENPPFVDLGRALLTNFSMWARIIWWFIRTITWTLSTYGPKAGNSLEG
ncbi:DNA-directed RNA polymerase III subunit RPC5 [Araneus ventricosus]|uniref:DNA-directed RNA polymerase III subunit RPC5 n=1 Tax=Araneus ventricosus TaxID=182803 RepID=A0A4Y2PB95_ARAVE|nr:DNA-directed RNA polymerase III subunit RPC5 [Araneus ventricosus]GBN47281.1 DNA-directed RNA polymerase III subunit RPC5 [Araneus ventricosus]